MPHSLPSKKSLIMLYLLLVSIACFGDAYALDDATTSQDDMPAETRSAETQSDTAPEPTNENDPTTTSTEPTTPAGDTLQLLEKLEALTLIATNPAYDHLNGTLSDISTQDGTTPLDTDNAVDFSLIQTSPHELALTQILSEICPPLLNESLHEQFANSYYHHLKLLMPTLDPHLVMPKINEHPEYAKILQGVREWTASYPDGENKALCAEFAEATF